jgi:hypothetical protein
MADLERVQKAVQSAASVKGVRELIARQNGTIIEIHGTADNLAAKQSAMRIIEDNVGDSHGIDDLIRIPTDPGREGTAEGTSSVRSVPTSTSIKP